jgi:predicted dehydrogenase
MPGKRIFAQCSRRTDSLSMRVAIIGAGLMGRWHAHYARQCGASICGVVDPNRTEAELRRRFRSAAPFKELQPLLRELKPDMLHVCTPADTHERIIEEGLASGTHLLVEKPMAQSAEITERFLVQAQESRLLLVPVHQYAFQEGVMQAASSLDSIGKPLHLDAVFCSAGGAQMHREKLEGLIADILPHPLSVLDRFFPGILGEIQWTNIHSGSGEWRTIGLARETSISILISLNGRPTEASLRLTGSKGTIRLDLFHGFGVIETGEVSRRRKITHPFSLAARTFWVAGRNLFRRTLQNTPAYPGLRRLIGLFYEAVELESGWPISPQNIIEIARLRDRLAPIARR